MLPTTSVTIEDKSDDNGRGQWCLIDRTPYPPTNGEEGIVLFTAEKGPQSQPRKDDECG